MLPTKFQVNWPFNSGEGKNRFSRWRPSWISYLNDFSYLISKSPQCLLLSFKSIGLLVQEKRRKVDFMDGRHGHYLGFLFGTILAIFDFFDWLFGSEEEEKKGFSRWLPQRPFWISDQNNFSYFDLPVAPMLPTKFQVNYPFGSEEVNDRFSRWRPSWTSDRNDFSYFWSTCHSDASYQVSSQLDFRLSWSK